MRLTARPLPLATPPRRRPTVATAASPSPPPPPPADDADEALLLADLERYSRPPAASSSSSPQPTSRRAPLPTPSSSPADDAPPAWKDALDKLLVADFFFVLLALAWLVVGVGVRAGGGSPAVADAWLALWPTLWQPAIGLLMAGALVSGGAGWLREKRGE